MKPKTIYATPEFLRLWKKVPLDIKKVARKKERRFRTNVFDPQLKTHKLRGNLSGFYSFSINYQWRIIFHIQGKDMYLDAIGTHAIYQ